MQQSFREAMGEGVEWRDRLKGQWVHAYGLVMLTAGGPLWVHQKQSQPLAQQ
jgi:hypothetical protein